LKTCRRDEELAKGWGRLPPPPLAVETAGGKQKVNCANVEGVLRIIQSIPSKKAESFKRWLAKVAGKARLDAEQEIGKSIISEDNYLGENIKKLQ